MKKAISVDSVLIFNSKFYGVDPGDHLGVLHVFKKMKPRRSDCSALL